MHHRYKLLAIILLVQLIISCDSISKQVAPDNALIEGIFPSGPGCKQLKSSRWKNANLYDLTYGCIPAGWESFFRQPAVRKELEIISRRLVSISKGGDKIEPAIGNTFKALYKVKLKDIKAIILGQDPAPQPGVATGLSFSTFNGVSSSRVASIQRVLLEARNEGYCVNLKNGNLSQWADRGVLLLNMALTIKCEPGKTICTIASNVPLWSRFTELLIRYINSNAPPSSFILWGGKAIAFKQYVTSSRHKVITGGHPSPAGSLYGKRFFCKNYYKCSNQWLGKNSRTVINWHLAKQCKKRKTACYWEWNSETRKSICVSRCIQRACYK